MIAFKSNETEIEKIERFIFYTLNRFSTDSVRLGRDAFRIQYGSPEKNIGCILRIYELPDRTAVGFFKIEV